MLPTTRPVLATSVAAAPTAHLFGLPITVVGRESAADALMGWAASPSARVLMTPNTDHFVRWQRDAGFRDLYGRADMSLVDGAPLVLLARLERIAVTRVTGASVFMALAQRAATDGVPLILVGGQPGVAERAARKLEERHTGLSIPLVACPSAEDLVSDEWLRSLAGELRQHPVKIVALCVGSPKQEALFAALRRVDPELSGVFLCVGAAIDFAAGTRPRAPRLMRRLGLEWLFRLVVEPRRLWRRYLVDDLAVMRFLLLAVFRGLARAGTRVRGQRRPVG